VELAAFSLCLALLRCTGAGGHPCQCQPFPPLAGKDACIALFSLRPRSGACQESIGVVTGNPPFTSTLTTPGGRAKLPSLRDTSFLPDKNWPTSFCTKRWELVRGRVGVLKLLQQCYNFLYKPAIRLVSAAASWTGDWECSREILDFIPLGAFSRKAAPTRKWLSVVAEASASKPATRSQDLSR